MRGTWRRNLRYLLGFWLDWFKTAGRNKVQSPAACRTQNQSVLSNGRITHPGFSPVPGQTTVRGWRPWVHQSSPRTSHTEQVSTRAGGWGAERGRPGTHSLRRVRCFFIASNKVLPSHQGDWVGLRTMAKFQRRVSQLSDTTAGTINPKERRKENPKCQQPERWTKVSRAGLPWWRSG